MTLSTGRAQEIWARLSAVTDPELDESVTELGFVSDVAVDDDGGVAIGFRLPTYWCAANFAFMMVDDLRQAAAAAPWVRRVSVAIDEHMYADEINRGMAHGLSFEAAFPEQASSDLSAVRRTFARKAFQRRQEAALRALLDEGHAPAVLLAMTVADARRHPHRLLARYLERRETAGPAAAAEPAFVDVDGGPIPLADLDDYLAALRRVTINVEFNGTLCRGLLAARYDDAPRVEDVESKPEPTLIDFIRHHRKAAGRRA